MLTKKNIKKGRSEVQNSSADEKRKKNSLYGQSAPGSEPHRIENCIHNMNMDLDRIHQWSIEHCLAINSKKSQALLVNPSILPSKIVSLLLLGSNHIAIFEKVKNLGIIFNQELSWHDQVAKLCKGLFFTHRFHISHQLNET
jgi:hypothetical protein